MQNIEKFLGFRIKVERVLPEYRLDSLKRRALLIASRLQLEPEDHHVYIHSLSIEPNTHTFLRGTKLHERVDSVVIGFWVNPKQVENKKIRVINHLFRDVLEPHHQYANYSGVQYTLTGSELEAMGTFSNEIIVFVHRSLPLRHRKLKIAVLARPAPKVRLRGVNGVVTRKDLWYDREIPIELSKRSRGVPVGSTAVGFTWRGPARTEDLHSFLRPEQEYLDVGEMKRMIRRSSAVCRVEIPEGRAYGTGVLITPNLVLTNFHVLAKGRRGQIDILDSAQQVVLRFGAVTDETGIELPGEIVRPDPGSPIVAASPTEKLDFVLLRLASPISNGFIPAPFSTAILKKRDALNILQYPILQPSNNPLKLTLKPNAITGIYPGIGRVQYVTYASRGASGAPCFNGSWEVVAIHRAEQSAPFGTRREGVLFSAIHELIEGHLEVRNA